MNTTLSEQSISTIPDDSRWPEQLKDEPTINPFPAKLLWKWLTPGIVGLAILFVIYGLLYQAANRKIVFLAPNGVLTTIHANRNPESQQSLGYRVPQFQEWDVSRQSFILSIPYWSPNGRYLAATVAIEDREQVAIFPSSLMSPTIITVNEQSTYMPDNGWSYSSRYLAVLTHDSEQSFVGVYDIRQQDYLSELQPIDTRAGLSWSPQRDELLFTTHADGMAAPILRIIDANGNLSNFTPEDNQLIHADGVWSPDGQQIAYIASSTYTNTQDVLWGSLWVADREGLNPRQIVADNYVFAPFWNPKGDYLYFTRFTRDARFELYRIPINGSERQEEHVGPGMDAVLFPFHRNLLAQWSPNNKQLLFLGHQRVSPDYLPVNEDIGTQIRQALPIKLISEWSPNSQQFAGTVGDGDSVAVLVFNAVTGQAHSYTAEHSDKLVFPANGWSPDGGYVALLRYDGANVKLAVLSPNDGSLGTTEFDLNLKAGFSWHPNGTQLIATSIEEGITTSLKIYDANTNSVRNFEPQDGQPVHGDGVWSPSGRQVAYITREQLTDTLHLDFLAGSLWLADSNGRSTQSLVVDGLNLAPIWSEDQQHVLFTRFITETETFKLYQVDITNNNVEYLGLSTSEFAEFPFDRSSLLEWSPDGRRWLLPGSRTNTPFILYSVSADNTNVFTFPKQCGATTPFAARWAPTNRGVLVGCPSGNMFLYWTDEEHDLTHYPDGQYPSWQP